MNNLLLLVRGEKNSHSNVSRARNWKCQEVHTCVVCVFVHTRMHRHNEIAIVNVYILCVFKVIFSNQFAKWHIIYMLRYIYYVSISQHNEWTEQVFGAILTIFVCLIFACIFLLSRSDGEGHCHWYSSSVIEHRGDKTWKKNNSQ